MKLPPAFERYRSEVDCELRAVLAERQSPLYDMMRYHLGWVDAQGRPLPGSGGKALRSTLCLLACEAVDGIHHRALPAAAAVELVHNFSLIHDDIQDDDRERRHRPTVWSIWGKPQAINAGTAMRVLASLALSRLGENGISGEKQLRAQRILDESCLRLIEGQYLDISYESRLDIVVTDYLEMIDGKTAALMGCSLELGALIGTDDESVIRGLWGFGRNLGLAFQIRDDILGIWGDQKETGKPLGSDIRRRKKSFPIVYALDKMAGEVKTDLTSIYQSEVIDEAGTLAVLKILDDVGAQRYAQKMVEMYRDKALGTIDELALMPAARRDLEGLAHFLVERNS
jgi:geranylgeranyl diphosphate synthase type I